MKIFHSQHQFGVFLSYSIQAQILGEITFTPIILPVSLGPFCAFRCLDMGQGGNAHRAAKSYGLQRCKAWARCWPTYIMTKELACGGSGYGMGTLWLTQRQLASFGKFYSNWNLRTDEFSHTLRQEDNAPCSTFCSGLHTRHFRIDRPPLEPGPQDVHTLSLALLFFGLPPMSPFYLLHWSPHQALIPKKSIQDI